MPFDPVSAGMLAMGIVTHQVLTLAKKSKEQHHPVNIVEHYKNAPYATTGTVLLSIIGYIGLASMGELTSITALGMGFTGDSVGNTMTELTKAKKGSIDVDIPPTA